jgi:hypothetical protein
MTEQEMLRTGSILRSKETGIEAEISSYDAKRLTVVVCKLPTYYVGKREIGDQVTILRRDGRWCKGWQLVKEGDINTTG